MTTHDDGTDDALRELLRSSMAQRFDAGFADRVLARLDRAPATTPVRSLDDAIRRTGRRMLPWLAAAAAALTITDVTVERRGAHRQDASADLLLDVTNSWRAYQ